MVCVKEYGYSWTMEYKANWNNKVFFSLTAVLGLSIIGFPSASAQIVNGGFETGDFTGWTVPAGSTPTVVTSLGTITPEEGSFMALLTSSGFGVPTPPGSFGEIISQPFTLAGNELSFCYQFFTSEGTPSAFDDFFLAELITTSGTFVIGSADTNGVPAGGAGAPPPPAISAGVTLTPAASGFSPTTAPFAEETAKICSSFVLPNSIKGSTASLKFTLGDLLDTSVDSAVLIDDVKLDGSTTCLMPSKLFPMVGGS